MCEPSLADTPLKSKLFPIDSGQNPWLFFAAVCYILRVWSGSL